MFLLVFLIDELGLTLNLDASRLDTDRDTICYMQVST